MRKPVGAEKKAPPISAYLAKVGHFDKTALGPPRGGLVVLGYSVYKPRSSWLASLAVR
jgi:hypothetical protein